MRTIDIFVGDDDVSLCLKAREPVHFAVQRLPSLRRTTGPRTWPLGRVQPFLGVARLDSCDPHFLRGSSTDKDLVFLCSQRHGFVVTALDYEQSGARPDAAFVEEAQQSGVLLVYATHSVALARFRFGQESESPASASLRAFGNDRVTMRANSRRSKFLRKLCLELGGDHMLELLGLFVHLVPLHAKHLGQHAFDQVVAHHRPQSHRPACSGQPDPAIGMHGHQAVPLQSPKRHGDCGSRDGKPVRQFSLETVIILSRFFSPL